MHVPQAHQRVDMGGYTLTENASLAQRNTLRVDARARLLADIRDASKLPELLDFPAIRRGPLLVLGEGSNLLFAGDFDGTVLAMAHARRAGGERRRHHPHRGGRRRALGRLRALDAGPGLRRAWKT